MDGDAQEKLAAINQLASDLLQNGGDPGQAEVTQSVEAANIVASWNPEFALILSVLILIFGLLVFLFMTYLLRHGHDTNQVLRVCALPLIIVSAIFLIVVGYSQQQIAPVMGLLGTIAGYLLGNTRKEVPDKPKKNDGVANKIDTDA